MNLWPWLPSRWFGHCTLGFPWAQEKIYPTATEVANLLLLKARRVHSVFHWYYHLAAIFVPFIGLEDGVAHVKALIKFTQQAL